MEKRIITFNTEMRAKTDEGPAEIAGRGAVVGVTTDLGYIEEEIHPEAFREADLSDVVVAFNHDLNYILGRSSANTAKITVSDDGNLEYVADDLDMENPSVKSVVRYIERGEVNKSSFMFEISGYAWEDSEKYGKFMKRVITKIGKVYETGPVTFPAYDDTPVAARSKDLEQREKWIQANVTPTEHLVDEDTERRAYWQHLYELTIR